MSKAKQSAPAKLKGIQPETASVATFPDPIQTILRTTTNEVTISHDEARALLRQVKDVVLDETGLTRQQLEYELYLRSRAGD
jgi:copper chaperone CopZ